ncbi:O-antigen ligase [Rhodococcus sp. 14-2470-1a]|uniref:O-antigen ligase family protein n=1 Tax=Rhodococcus sp. 14-2470-1a TaxID=2023150 RepID=UPI000B9B5C72|nr:O-antigen ligase family protein [Rhodococcus sp. 14-2470-1a]OZF55495.1 hypothetical protein CH292_05940 [Rhodococcus sp. 14-2470-1a]
MKTPSHGQKLARVSLALVVFGSALYPKQYGVYLVLLGLLGLLLLVGDAQLRTKRVVPVTAALLLAYLFISCLWSSDFRFSLVSAIVYSAIALSAYLAAWKFTWATLIRGASLALRAAIVVSWVLVAFDVRSSYSIASDVGFAINGLYVHSNQFATVCVLGIVTFVTEWRLKLVGKLSGVGWVVVGIATLWFTDSRTGLVVAVFAGVSGILLVTLGRSRMSSSSLSVVSVVALAGSVWLVLMTPLSEVSVALGRSSDLTGRTEIWTAVIREIGRGPWFGTGFMAAWRSNNPATQRIWHDIGFHAGHAHNGYLDLVLQLGVVGTFLVMIILIWMVVSSVAMFSDTKSAYYGWVFAISVSQLVYNITETRITFGVVWFLIFLGYFKLQFETTSRRGCEDRPVGDDKVRAQRRRGVVR